jgi:hypothetical protein
MQSFKYFPPKKLAAAVIFCISACVEHHFKTGKITGLLALFHYQYDNCN